MQPKGPLMIEHRLIERMIALMDKEATKIEKTREINHSFIMNAVDFIRVYADQTHHGKEENILFRDLLKKELSEADRTLTFELMNEHVFARTVTGELYNAANAFLRGDTSALSTVLTDMKKLVDFYPVHIEKEDKIFFPASMAYFSEYEQLAMLDEFWEFDKKMIHTRYQIIVESLERTIQP
jgi:hemerythrin-like domain-containing protein